MGQSEGAMLAMKGQFNRGAFQNQRRLLCIRRRA
jgi:hypothetical protein